MRKRIYSILLAIALLATIIPITVLADSNPVSIVGGSSYANIQEAINAATNGQTIQLNANCTENIVIPTGKEVTIDLKGNVLTGTGNDSVIKVKSNAILTLTDSSTGGKITGGTGTLSGSERLGGGVFVETNGTFTMNGGTISNCSATKGGGVFTWGRFIMNYDSAIVNCTANVDGGGVCACNGSFTMNGNSKVSECTAGNGAGGVYIFGSKDVNAIFTMNGSSTISNCSASANYAANKRSGGGVCIEGNHCTFIMNNETTICNNNATTTGGGVNVYSGTFNMSGGTIAGNSATDGGGVFVTSGNTFNMSGGTISDNTAINCGGGVNVQGTFIMENGVIEHNSANPETNNTYFGGGGVAIYEYGKATLSGGKIQYNTSTQKGGGVLILQKGPTPSQSVLLTGTSITNNIAATGGGGIYYDNSYVTIQLNGSTKINGNVLNGTITNTDTGYSLSGGTKNNLHFSDRSTKLNLIGDVDSRENMSVGITMQTPPGQFTTNGTADDVQYFKSDDSNYVVKYNTSGYLELTVAPTHTHAFTYTASNGKVTATCTDGCTEGWDTAPLTLTLTAPASLVYDGSAKECAFASGEGTVWTGAGLQLPTITYTAKSGSSLTNNNAINAGSYTASITVDTNKTASLDFEITKATPYIKTDPAPSDIELGQKLSNSILVGYAQVSSTDSTTVAGLFEWAEPDTMPTIADSEVTLYNVTFTPVDETNYNTASCRVTIRVNHTHNPVLVNGQEPTESAAGWKDYYECICGDLYEDANGATPIDDFAAWKAENGNGYIAPLVHNPELVNGKDATETAAGYKAYYKCDNCGKYFEDEACTTEINDLAAWKAEGGNGYIPKLEPADPTPEPEPINYKITQGANSIWVVAAGESPVFRSNADFSKFSHVLLDGKELAKKHYKYESGSTLITLTPEYTATLAVGKHTIEIVSTDGSAATVFYIEETIADTNGEGFALSTATMSSLFVACNIVGLSAVFFEIKKKKKVK